ncbi:hypothetical protein OROMI_021484 [Orobanche minor]
MLVAKVLLLPLENHWKLVVLMLVAKVLPASMGKSLEIGRAYACGQGAAVLLAAVAIGKSLEIGRAYA